jgi:hypothetical protein
MINEEKRLQSWANQVKIRRQEVWIKQGKLLQAIEGDVESLFKCMAIGN